MARLLTLLMLAGALSACSTGIPGPQNLQFSGAEEAFPADYQARALRALGDQAVAGMSISYPRLVMGETAFSARRWYVCVRGVPTTSKPAKTTKPLLDLVGNLTQPGQSQGIYEVVIILRANGSSAQIKGYDAPLCADGRYETLPVG